MALTFAPVPPWHTVALVLALVAGALLLTRLLRDRLRSLGADPRLRAAIGVLEAAVAAALVLAAFNPLLVPDGAAEGHLAVAIDVSESVQRAGRDWDETRRLLRERLRQGQRQLQQHHAAGAERAAQPHGDHLDHLHHRRGLLGLLGEGQGHVDHRQGRQHS